MAENYQDADRTTDAIVAMSMSDVNGKTHDVCHFKYELTCELEHIQFGDRVDSMRLLYATAMGDVQGVTKLLDARACVNAADYMGQTPLHIAASLEMGTNVAQLLIDNKAKVNALDFLSRTPLAMALTSGSQMVEVILASNGAKIQKERLNRDAQRESWAISQNDVICGEEIGSTLKSTVYKAKWRETDVVVKVIKEEGTKIARTSSTNKLKEGHTRDEEAPEEQELLEELLHEISILQSLRHPDLVMFLGACLEEKPIMFLTEYMPGGDLERYYQAQRKAKQGLYRPDMLQLLSWARALFRALAFLHGMPRPIIHRDLKPLNLLLNRTLELKVADFGISKLTTDRVCVESYKMTGGVGSLRYMAPEVVRHQRYNEKADIYSAALILYFMSSGRNPFHEMGSNPELVLKEYLKGQEPRPQLNECHKALRSTMKEAWHVNLESRPSAVDLVHQLSEVPVSSTPCCPVS